MKQRSVKIERKPCTLPITSATILGYGEAGVRAVKFPYGVQLNSQDLGGRSVSAATALCRFEDIKRFGEALIEMAERGLADGE